MVLYDFLCSVFPRVDMVLANLTLWWEREGGTQRVPGLPRNPPLLAAVGHIRGLQPPKEIDLGGPSALQTSQSVKRIAAKRNLVYARKTAHQQNVKYR